MCDPWSLLRAKTILVLSLAVGAFGTGCEDPSNVGLGLIGESGGDPARLHLPAQALPPDVSASITGNVRSSLGFTTGPARILAGTVSDPLFGTLTTKAYIDVAPSTSQSTDYQSGTITAVELELIADYVYGDTMATTSLILSDMNADWLPSGMPSDTTLMPGAEIVRMDYGYSDTMFVVALPEAWYSANSTTLLSDDLVDLFHGFELSTSDPSAVVGYKPSSAILRVVTTTGSAEFVVSKIFTRIERMDDANVPPGRAVIQDGIGQNLNLSFDFEADSLVGTAVSRAVIELKLDQASMDDTPEHFVRPNPPQFDLVGVRPDGTTRLLRSTSIADSSIRFISTNAAPGEITMVRVIQAATAGNAEYSEYRIRIAEVQAAINAVLVFSPSAESDAPQAVLTVTPNSF